MNRLVVFDLDGTLVDSRRDLANAANALVTGYGGTPLSEEAVGSMVGDGATMLVRRALAASGLDPDLPDALPRYLELYDQRLLEHTRPYEGIVELLEALRTRANLTVLTNKPQAATEKLLDGLELTHYFNHIVGGDTPFGRKPDPAGLLDIVRRASTTAGSTTLVGDSPVDLETARRGGCAAVLVRYGFGYREVDLRVGEHVIAHPSELPALF